MKLSHAVLRMRTAIAELRRAIGVGSGALLGVMVKMARHQDSETNARICANIANLPATRSLVNGCCPKHNVRNTSRRSRCVGTARSWDQKYNHPENAAVASTLQSDDEAEQATKHQERTMKRFRLIALTTILYLPPIVLWLTATGPLQLRPLLLLICQSWITMSATAVVVLVGFCWWGEAWLMTPNEKSSATAEVKP